MGVGGDDMTPGNKTFIMGLLTDELQRIHPDYNYSVSFIEAYSPPTYKPHLQYCVQICYSRGDYGTLFQTDELDCIISYVRGMLETPQENPATGE